MSYSGEIQNRAFTVNQIFEGVKTDRRVAEDFAGSFEEDPITRRGIRDAAFRFLRGQETTDQQEGYPLSKTEMAELSRLREGMKPQEQERREAKRSTFSIKDLAVLSMKANSELYKRRNRIRDDEREAISEATAADGPTVSEREALIATAVGVGLTIATKIGEGASVATAPLSSDSILAAAAGIATCAATTIPVLRANTQLTVEKGTSTSGHVTSVFGGTQLLPEEARNFIIQSTGVVSRNAPVLGGVVLAGGGPRELFAASAAGTVANGISWVASKGWLHIDKITSAFQRAPAVLGKSVR